MKREYIPDGRFFRVSNFIFNYPLTPIERTVYFYLLCLAGSRGYCWPSVKTIADKCRCSPSAVRNAIKTLERQGFIKVYHTYQENGPGKNRQSNNQYFINALPPNWRETEPVRYKPS